MTSDSVLVGNTSVFWCLVCSWSRPLTHPPDNTCHHLAELMASPKLHQPFNPLRSSFWDQKESYLLRWKISLTRKSRVWQTSSSLRDDVMERVKQPDGSKSASSLTSTPDREVTDQDQSAGSLITNRPAVILSSSDKVRLYWSVRRRGGRSDWLTDGWRWNKMKDSEIDTNTETKGCVLRCRMF